MAPSSLCLITALAPVPAFLGGSCPLGCSLRPCHRGESLWLAGSCMRQAPRKRSLCLTTAWLRSPAFLGGSCPLGCSLSAPATGGFSVFSPLYRMYAAGSEKEKRAGCPLHGGTIAQSFVIWQWGVAEAVPLRRGLGMGGRFWPAPSFSEGIWLDLRRCPTCPPSNVFGYRGTPAVPRAGAAPPAPCLGRADAS